MPRSNSSLRFMSSKLSTTSVQLLSIKPSGSIPAGPLLYVCSSSPLNTSRKRKESDNGRKCVEKKKQNAISACVKMNEQRSDSFYCVLFEYIYIYLLCTFLLDFAAWLRSGTFTVFLIPDATEKTRKLEIQICVFLWFFRRRWPWTNLFSQL